MKVIKFFMMLSVFWLLSIQSRCKKEEEIDSCANLGVFKAGFMLGEIVGDSLVETDTIMNINFQVAMRADDNYDSVKWRIGGDPRDFLNQQTVKLSFPSSLAGESIKVTMFARGKPNNVCPLPTNDDGLDTVVKYFKIACNPNFVECKNSPKISNKIQTFIGKWRGSNSDNPNREFDVQIVDFGEGPSIRNDTLFYNLRIYNLPENCGGPQDFLNSATTACGGKVTNPFFYAPEVEEFGFSSFYVSGGIGAGCCPPMAMFGRIDKKDRNMITINQILNKTGAKKTFVGRRL
jgi:hypothetical protein